VNKNLLRATVLFFVSLTLASCAGVPSKGAPGSPGGFGRSLPVARNDLYHVVGPAETLWRISKMYDVPMREISEANDLKPDNKLQMGQQLLIPDAAPLKPVIPLYKSRAWPYIIVHHSATDEGNALSLFELHKRRGWDSLGYHFIIDNGTSGKLDGQIEVSPRWIKQQDGAHCKAANMNQRGIGVCLVGNFSKDDVSPKQMESLIYLVNILRKHYKVPLSNIMGHGQVSGAATECPGLYFPWDEFWTRLKKARSYD